MGFVTHPLQQEQRLAVPAPGRGANARAPGAGGGAPPPRAGGPAPPAPLAVAWRHGPAAALRWACAAGALATTRLGASASIPERAAVEDLLAR
ncbi:hypothetical protein [Nocardia farcinica]|uniref:hypothetical protein n=1 Tax=Nocardia farcinica TaxID=37329 RepID=UPI003CC7E550